jgi:SAM-dependent methyltransferase
MATLRWQPVSQLLDRLSPHSVLEVGCGQGGFGARIAARPSVSHYVGVEPDEQSWRVAHERITPLGGDVRLGPSDMVGADERFDLVCAFEVIEHLEDDLGALTSWARHLVPGGALLVSVPAGPERFGPMDTLVGHYRRYTADQLRTTLLAAGCQSATVTSYGWPLGYALESVRNRIATHRTGQSDLDGMDQRSATSGRLLQPKRLAGIAVGLAVTPFAAMQKWRPETGTGLIGFALA